MFTHDYFLAHAVSSDFLENPGRYRICSYFSRRMCTKSSIGLALRFEPVEIDSKDTGGLKRPDVCLHCPLSISFLMLCGALLGGPPALINQPGWLLRYPGSVSFSFRLAGVGATAALGLVSFPESSAARFLQGATLRLCASASASDTNVEPSTGGPNAGRHRSNDTVSHPVNEKNYLVYLFFAFSILVVTAATLFRDIRRKSRSGKRETAASS
jgi:hypothetical protein